MNLVDEANRQPLTARSWWPKVLIALTVIAVIVSVSLQLDDKLQPEYLAERQVSVIQLREENPLAVFSAAFAVYVVVIGVSIPIAGPLSLFYGWYFPFWQALVLVSFSSSIGATLSFLLSRYLFRDAIQLRFATRLIQINETLEREGIFYLFSLRLTPAVPAWTVNLLMGLTPMRATTFYWVSQLGMLPGTMAYLYGGSQLPDLKSLGERKLGAIFSPGLLAAFAVLALMPFVLRAIMRRVSPKS